ncbi:MAG: hypothetical protein K2X07_07640 [Caulobacteraceae bacterium]|nr:hypothetical protein [Caulobacteraceae bacterium]
MRLVFIVGLGAIALSAGHAAAQDAAPEVALPLVEGMTFDDTCGPRPQYQGKAVCVTGPLASIAPVAETYIGHFSGQGWQVVSGQDNGVIFARRRSTGGCDGLEMAAFYDESRPVAPATAGWIAFAPIPGDVCPAAAAQ